VPSSLLQHRRTEHVKKLYAKEPGARLNKGE